MIKLGNSGTKLYLGDSEVEKIYLGTEQVYGGEPTPVPYDEQYLTIESTSDNNTIYWRSNISNQNETISASTDNGSTWTAYTSSSGQTGTTIATLNSGGKLLVKGENAQYNSEGIFKSTSSFVTYGNIMSLVYGDNFSGQTTLTSGGTFSYLFSGCTGLASAENLILPATTLTDNCYQYLFANCTSLTTAPALPATTLAFYCYSNMFAMCSELTTAPELPTTTLANSCYLQMFRDCTSLTIAPALPATTLAEGCYYGMFDSCTSLTTAPALPATTLVQSCYESMFNGCTNLTTAPVLSATTLGNSCYSSMFNGCTSLTTAPALPATTLAENCYSWMFRDCTSLTVAPALPATTLTNNCYAYMFNGCTSLVAAPSILPATTLAFYCYSSMFAMCSELTTAPVLPATTLEDFSYESMFYGCFNLNYIKCLATDILAFNCTNNWVNSVASDGTFVKAASMTGWTEGENGIPRNWTVQDYDDDPASYSRQYLTTESQEDNNTISFTMGTGMTTAITTAVTSVSVSTDDGLTWTSMQNMGANASLSVTLNNGEKALWKGEALGYSTATASTRSTVFSSTGTYKVYGNITSLLYDDDFLNYDNPTLPDFNCFANLFYGSTGLTDASNLIMHFELPATTSKRQLGYMFQGCTSLVNAPELKNIGFGGSQYTFRNMFRDCTSLTVAPELTATTLTQGCYAYMFNGCTSLNYIKCLATNISASNCTTNWVSGVSSTGTFVKAASMTGGWIAGTSGIPQGWTIQNDDGSPYDDGDGPEEAD